MGTCCKHSLVAPHRALVAAVLLLLCSCFSDVCLLFCCSPPAVLLLCPCWLAALVDASQHCAFRTAAVHPR